MTICPTCGEPCAQAWCGFCERALPYPGSPFPPSGCCAIGTCTDPDCYICVRMPQRFHVDPCPHWVDEEHRCRYIAGHRPPCKASDKKHKSENVLRDGDPKTKRRDPTFTPRRRVGPHR